MSRIMVPSKPSWKVTILVDQNNQAQITVQDMLETIRIPGVAPRQMNQIQLALLLSNIVSSSLVNTLSVSMKGKSDAPKEENHDGGVS